MNIIITACEAEYRDGLVIASPRLNVGGQVSGDYRNIAELHAAVLRFKDSIGDHRDAQLLLIMLGGRKINGFDAYRHGQFLAASQVRRNPVWDHV